MINAFFLSLSLFSICNALYYGGKFIPNVLIVLISVFVLVVRSIKAKWIKTKTANAVIGLILVLSIGFFSGTEKSDLGFISYSEEMDRVYYYIQAEDGTNAGILLHKISSEYRDSASYKLASAKAAYLRGDMEETTIWLDRLNDNQRRLEDYYSLRLLEYIKEENYEVAMAVFNKALHQFPDWSVVQICSSADNIEADRIQICEFIVDQFTKPKTVPYLFSMKKND